MSHTGSRTTIEIRQLVTLQKIILHLIRADPTTPIRCITKEVQVIFHSRCSYKKGWYACKSMTNYIRGLKHYTRSSSIHEGD